MADLADPKLYQTAVVIILLIYTVVPFLVLVAALRRYQLRTRAVAEAAASADATKMVTRCPGANDDPGTAATHVVLYYSEVPLLTDIAQLVSVVGRCSGRWRHVHASGAVSGDASTATSDAHLSQRHVVRRGEASQGRPKPRQGQDQGQEDHKGRHRLH